MAPCVGFRSKVYVALVTKTKEVNFPEIYWSWSQATTACISKLNSLDRVSEIEMHMSSRCWQFKAVGERNGN